MNKNFVVNPNNGDLPFEMESADILNLILSPTNCFNIESNDELNSFE